MRLYTFTNFYLSSIQAGIQTAHVVHELFNKYDEPERSRDYILREWSLNHKTIIVLNGGAFQDIADLLGFFDIPYNPYPFSGFYEDVPSLNGMLTTVGIVLPDYIYEVAELVRSHKAEFGRDPEGTYRAMSGNPTEGYQTLNDHEYTEWEVELIERLNGCGLAR
jgi:hypothetical protein